eukprot:m.63117 g.63117  ORF g.63117 m.63117 type:complete len:540 (-) comp15830_c1_seq3:143-1762(-)
MSALGASVVRLTDLDDFITPGIACIKPVESAFKPAPDESDSNKVARGTIAIEQDGRYMEVGADGSKTELPKAKITLNDCLACSGCITSAESVLVEMQTYKELEEVLAQNRQNTWPDASATTNEIPSEATTAKQRAVVVSLSPQTCAALAVKYNVTAFEAAERLCGFFKGIGVHRVYDVTLARTLSLIESRNEFFERMAKAEGGVARKSGILPMLASQCPGWVCYAEKTHGDFVLPYISTTKSPQQIMGALAKSHQIEQQYGNNTVTATNTDPVVSMDESDDVSYGNTVIPPCSTPADVYHVCVMPCYDKKLEASRDDFYSDVYKTRDVDCVITTGELSMMLDERGVDFAQLSRCPLDSPLRGAAHQGHVTHRGGGAGGYLEYLFKSYAKSRFGIDDAPIAYESRRNPDLREVKLVVDGDTKLRFAAAYGFKSIQTIMRQMKRNKCTYDYIEIMACPKGCNNGGGQLSPQQGGGAVESGHLALVEKAYVDGQIVEEDPGSNRAVTELYADWQTRAVNVKDMLHTQYHPVEKTIVPQLESW